MSKNEVISEIDFLYCPKCANRLEKHPPKVLICKSCGLDLYVNPRPSNAVLLIDSEDRILLTKRKFEPGAGLWDLPGGFVDIGETVEQSIDREMREELGVSVKNIKYLCSGHDRYIFKGLNYHTIGMVFKAEIAGGDLVAHDDVESFKFFAKSEIPWSELAFPVLKEMLITYFSD